jgi:putative Mg2+ transporter-C (MgtC) family protein
MDWKKELFMALQALIAAVLGGVIGWQRQTEGHEAGVRTYGAVALGACLFALIASHVTGGNNAHVIPAGVVTGIGFLGAGTILRSSGKVSGLTTAATIWATSATGLLVGYAMFVLGAFSAVLIFLLLIAHNLPGWPAKGAGKEISNAPSSSSTELDTLDEGS